MLRKTHKAPPGSCRARGGKFGQASFLAAWLPVLWLAGCAAAPPAVDAGPTESAAVVIAQPSVEGVQGSKWDRRNEVRCTDGKITGSHFQRRICLTEAQWDKLEEDGKQALRELQGPKTGAR